MDSIIDNFIHQTPAPVTEIEKPIRIISFKDLDFTNLVTSNKEDVTLIWFDENIDKRDDVFDTKLLFQETNHYVLCCADKETCLRAIKLIKNEKIILVLSGKFAQDILEQIHSYEQMDSIFIFCYRSECNLNANLTNNSMNIPFVSQLLITYKIKSTIARFLDRECINQCNLGNLELGAALRHQRTQILEQFHLNDKLKGCHILLIPLNATPRDLHNAQQRLRYICYSLYGDEYTFIIHTLFDYIPEDEKNPDKQSYTAYLEKRYNGDICRTIMKLSFIRMYLIGNELHVPNQWSQKLAETELDINQNHDLQYVDRCSFIINQPVANRFTQNLVPIFGSTWQMGNAVARTLDDIRDDIHFQDILPRIYGCLENREMTINSELHQITRFSNEIRPIQQARNGPEERQEIDDIRSMILPN